MATGINALNARLEAKAKQELRQTVHARAYEFVNALRVLGVSEYDTLTIKNGGASTVAVVLNSLPKVLADAVVAYYGPRYALAAVEKFIEKVESIGV